MDGIVIVVLFALIAAWLLGRIAKMVNMAIRPKSYVTMVVVVVIGVLLLYAASL